MDDEPLVWKRLRGIYGCKRYLTQKQYEAQSSVLKSFYELNTPPQVDECVALRKALANLVRDSMASDFNEHWDSYKEAEKLLLPKK